MQSVISSSDGSECQCRRSLPERGLVEGQAPGLVLAGQMDQAVHAGAVDGTPGLPAGDRWLGDGHGNGELVLGQVHRPPESLHAGLLAVEDGQASSPSSAP